MKMTCLVKVLLKGCPPPPPPKKTSAFPAFRDRTGPKDAATYRSQSQILVPMATWPSHSEVVFFFLNEKTRGGIPMPFLVDLFLF